MDSRRAAGNIARGLAQLLRYADAEGPSEHFEEGQRLLRDGLEEVFDELNKLTKKHPTDELFNG